MPRIKDTLWCIEPHTLAKHEILRRYLGAWFAILGSKIPRIMYLDGFCGPGRYADGELGSPIIALQTALSHSERLKSSELIFFFIDERDDRISHLQDEVNKLGVPGNFKIIIQTGEFHNIFASVLDDLEKRSKFLVPTFAFVDPFGFSGVPFTLIRRVLSMPKAEVFVNIMMRDVNRFADHPDAKTKQHVINLFGTREVLEVIEKKNERLTNLRQLYLTQLQKHARFVRYFEMRDQRNQVVYYLFFASNHPLGHEKIKEAFWRIDPSSGFNFSDATNPKQMVLFDIDPAYDLAKILCIQFGHQRVLSERVIKYVLDETPYLSRHARSAMKLLERNGAIRVDENKIDGSKRRKGSFPEGTIIDFP